MSEHASHFNQGRFNSSILVFWNGSGRSLRENLEREIGNEKSRLTNVKRNEKKEGRIDTESLKKGGKKARNKQRLNKIACFCVLELKIRSKKENQEIGIGEGFMESLSIHKPE